MGDLNPHMDMERQQQRTISTTLRRLPAIKKNKRRPLVSQRDVYCCLFCIEWRCSNLSLLPCRLQDHGFLLCD